MSLNSCIFVFGPSFAGKTCLVSRLVLDFPQIKTVNYELHYRPNCETKVSMTGFYDHIVRLLHEGEQVIAETVNDFQQNAHYHRHDLSRFTPLNILVMPEYRRHYQNMESFRDAFGSRPTRIRNGGRSVSQLRQDLWSKLKVKDYVTYDATNYDDIRTRVEQHLGPRKEASHGSF